MTQTPGSKIWDEELMEGRTLVGRSKSIIKNVDRLNSIDGDMYPPNQPKLNFGQLGTH